MISRVELGKDRVCCSCIFSKPQICNTVYHLITNIVLYAGYASRHLFLKWVNGRVLDSADFDLSHFSITTEFGLTLDMAHPYDFQCRNITIAPAYSAFCKISSKIHACICFVYVVMINCFLAWLSYAIYFTRS